MKKFAKTSVCFLLLAVLTLGMFACGETTEPENTSGSSVVSTAKPEETESPYDDNGYLKDSLPADMNFGADFTLLYWSDREHEEFVAETETGEGVNDAIYRRNAIVADRTGINWQYATSNGNASAVNQTEFATKVEASKNSGEGAYDMIAAHSYTIGNCAVKGLTTDLMQLDYLDWEKPWWPDNLIKQATMNDKLYFASGDISANVIYMMYVTFFNRDLITERNLEDPYQLVKDRKWTIDKMFEMCEGIYEDKDGSGTPSLGDLYGQYTYTLHLDMFLTGCGISFLDTSGDEVKISETFTSQKAVDLCAKLADFFHSNDKAYLMTENKSVHQWFGKGLSLFWNDRCRNASTFKENEIPFGIVPNPMYDENQDNYITVLGNPFSLYAIPTDAKDKNASAAVMECYASESYRVLSPQLYEVTMKYRFTDDSTSAEMFDLVKSTVAFDLGRIYATNFSNPYATFESAVSNKTAWTTATKAMTKKTWPNALKTLLESFS